MRSSLLGKRILILRPEKRPGDLAERLGALGAIPVAVPSTHMNVREDWTGIDAQLERLEDFDWVIFTSGDGVHTVTSRLRATQNEARRFPKVAAIGPATADALREARVDVTWMPSVPAAEKLASEFPGTSGPVLLVRTQPDDHDLDRALVAKGFEVRRVYAYGTDPHRAEIAAELAKGIDAVALTSPYIAHSFVEALHGSVPSRVALCCIDQDTALACREAGLDVAVVAEDETMAGLITAMEKHFDTRET